MEVPEMIQQIADAGNGTVKEVMDFGNGRAGAVLSFPLRKDHWIYQKDPTAAGFEANVPPMPLRMGEGEMIIFSIGVMDDTSFTERESIAITREQMKRCIHAAGKYAVRCSTLNGSEMDFDPDAMLQNLVVGMLGYWTKDGLSGDPEDAKWCDPQAEFDFGPPTRESSMVANTAQGMGSTPMAPASNEVGTEPAQTNGE